jgi:hypothetical protein
VVDADNALAGTNAISFEDIFPTGSTNNSNYVIPLVFKNYGGGVHKWNSVVTGCLTRGVPGAQPVVFEFFPLAGASGGPFNITRSTNPGGCLVINLNSFDPDDPEFFDPLAALPDGAYTISVSSTAGLPVPIAPERPGGFFSAAINYTTTGRMATQTNAAPPLGGGEGLIGFRELYGPLLFKRYNDWNTGMVVSNFRARIANLQGLAGGGGSGSGISISMYGEDGTLFGTFLDRLGNMAARVYYLPTLPIQLPDGFRGTSIVSIGDNTFGTRTAVGAHHVNYERNQAMAFNFVRQDQLTGPASPYYRPCTQLIGSTTDTNPAFPFGAIGSSAPFTGAAFVTCLSVPDAQRRFTTAPRGTSATFEVGMGPTTGVRIFNPDVAKLGLPAYVFATYTDAAGIYYTDSYTTFTIPAYGTGTIFMGADARLPDIFDGAMYIQATQPIAAIANVVDYRAVDRDGSYAYNIPNQTGQTN